jgi:hypothetical protein
MFTSTRNPHGAGTTHFDNTRLESLIGEYQAKGDAGSLGEIVKLTQTRALTLIRFHRTTRYVAEDELLSDVNYKLIRAFDKFDPAKGSAFTFISRVVTNVLCMSVTNARNTSDQYTELSSSLLAALVAKPEDRSAVDDITHRIKASARTALTDPVELSAQRWYVESFTQDGFESRRHECAHATMGVHQLSHARSRELYDLTMLEVRRTLYDDVARKRSPIIPGQLNGTKLAWLTRYAHLMSVPGEFTKFVVLMRDLAPYVLLIIDRENNNSHRHDRKTVRRKNIELILNGDPDALPLF